MTTKSEIFKYAHEHAKRAMAEQIEIKHPSAHKSYRELFALCLRGYHILQASKNYVPVEKPKFMWLRGM
jgi:glyoxylate utilization-related uncharacterized protein